MDETMDVGEWDGSRSEAMAAGLRKIACKRGDSKEQQRSGPLEWSANVKGHERRVMNEGFIRIDGFRVRSTRLTPS